MSGETEGVRCPRCNSQRHEVTHTRHKWGRLTIRYRQCRYCGHRFRTAERLVNIPDEPDATSGTKST
jgi:transcriptional regulator NrdR family protein